MFQKAKVFLLTKFSPAQETGIFLMIFVTGISLVYGFWNADMLDSSKEEGYERLQEKEKIIISLSGQINGEKSLVKASAQENDCKTVIAAVRYIEPEKPEDSVKETSPGSVDPETSQTDMAKADIRARIDEIEKKIQEKTQDLQALQASPGTAQPLADSGIAKIQQTSQQ
ncbi:MAG: hypothetical protein WC926_02290 [Candidatus Paceibacterota bacterium]|jgi:hypothetical protein